MPETSPRGRSNVIHWPPSERTRRMSPATSSTEPSKALRPPPLARSASANMFLGAKPTDRPALPASSRIVAIPFSMSARLRASGCQASPSSATRRSAGAEIAPGSPPTQIGGWGAWAGRKRGAREGQVLAGEARLIGAPGGLDHAQILVGLCAALAERQPEVLELFLVPADPDAEDEAAARGLVDGRRGLRGHEWVAVGQHDDARANVDPPRPARDEGQERERIGPVRAVVLGGRRRRQDVIGHEHAVQSEVFGSQRQVLCIAHRQLPDREDHAVFHPSLLVRDDLIRAARRYCPMRRAGMATSRDCGRARLSGRQAGGLLTKSLVTSLVPVGNGERLAVKADQGWSDPT